MKKKYLWPILLVTMGFVAVFFLLKKENYKSISKNEYTPKEIWDAEYLKKKEKRKIGYSKANKPDMFTKYFRDITTRIGEEKPGYKMNYKVVELAKAKRLLKNSHILNGTLNWKQRGPANVGGRTRGLIVDPDDSTHNTWFAGAVSGGIWKTTTGGANWQNLSDNFTNLSISALEMAPSNHDILYAGTGESFPGGTFMIGNGIWKSSDRGNTWIQLSSTATYSDFEYINRIIVDPINANIVLSATETGILKSTDGGTSWTKVFSSKHGVEDLVADPTNFNILFGGENTAGILRSSDAGNTWAISSSGLESGTRFEIAVSPVDHNNVFTSVNISDTQSKVFISNDNGLNWKRFNNTQNFLGGQGDYDNTIVAHPYIADEVYVGGVDIWKLKFNGTNETSSPLIRKAYTVNTDFLTFINFDGDFLGGGMSSTSGTNVLSSDWVSVEIRFGAGLSQKAHRFTVPLQATSGVPAANFTYAGYVDVPFQVWDVTNNRQLMVSFRDQEKDGAYNLYERTGDNYGQLGREYIFVNSVLYNPFTPDSHIAQSGGHLYKNLYMFWPNLAKGSSWIPASLPNSKIVVEYGPVTLFNGAITSIADAYGNNNGPNGYYQSEGLGKTAIPGLHPDHHKIVIIPSGDGNYKMIEANDGGLAISNDNGETFTQLPDNYITTQFYGVAKNPAKNEYIGGMQDNGTWRSPANEDASESSKYLFQIGGDGFECLWHAENPSLILGSKYNNEFNRSANGGATWSGTSGIENDDGPFISRLSASKEKPDMVFAVGNRGIYKSVNFGSSWTRKLILTNWSVGDSEVTSAHHVEVSLSNGNIVWAGAAMAKSYGLQLQVSTDEGSKFKAIEDYNQVAMNTYISGFATHPSEDSTAYALFSLSGAPKVLRTKNLGKSWEDISGFGTNSQSSNGFPDVIVHSLVVMPNNPNIIWIGTEIGLFESIDNGASWHYANNGLPPVSIYQMKIFGDQVVLATHGRGIWSVTIPEINNVPFISEFKHVGALNLSITANLKVAYDSVKVYLDYTKYAVLTSNDIGANSIPLTVLKAGTHSTFIQGYIGGIAYKSNTIDLTFLLTGIGDKAENNRVNIYPNPASSYFMFDLDEKYKKYRFEIFNLSGQIIRSQEQFNTGNNSVNVDFLKEGTYIINLYYDERKISKTLIIKR